MNIEIILMIITITITCALALFALWTFIRYRREIDQVPGPPIHSLLSGNLNLFLKPKELSIKQYVIYIYDLLLEFCNQYRSEGVFRLWFGPFHSMFILTNVQCVESLLSSSVNINKAYEYRFMSPWLGDGLLLATAEKWRPRRKLLTPAFHFKILENFIPIFARHTSRLICQIDQSKSIINDIRPLMENLTLDIINETSMGIDYDKVNGPTANESYRTAMKNAFRGVSLRAKNPLVWIDLFYRFTEKGKRFYKSVQTMKQYTNNVINKRMKEFKHQQNKTKLTIFLDILLEKLTCENENNIQLIQSEVNTFILGGHDTTAMALTFTVLMVASHPTVQERIYEELETIFYDDINRPINIEDLKQMRYLEMCIKETLRLYPSIQMVGRRLTETLQLPNGLSLPANSTCYVPILALHLNPEIYPNPKQFDPDRFGLNNQFSNNPYSYIPFSAGPRNCIGQKYALLELKYVLADLFRKYHVKSLTEPETIVKDLSPVIKPLSQIPVEFTKRSTKPIDGARLPKKINLGCF